MDPVILFIYLSFIDPPIPLLFILYLSIYPFIV